MNFKEYLNQEFPTRQMGVTIEVSDCASVYRVGNELLAVLNVNDKSYRYLMVNDTMVTSYGEVPCMSLWGMDEEGNPDRPSCFQTYDLREEFYKVAK